MDFEECVIAVRFTRKQCFKLGFGSHINKAAQKALTFKDASFILLGFSKLDECQGIIMVALKSLDGIDLCFKTVSLTQEFLRLFRRIPKIWSFRKSIQFCEALLCWLPVKDASSATRRTA
jgi:hypothetical protein